MFRLFDDSMFKVDFYLRIKLTNQQYLEVSKNLAYILGNEASMHCEEINNATGIDTETIINDINLLQSQFSGPLINTTIPAFLDQIESLEDIEQRKLLMKALFQRLNSLLIDYKSLLENTHRIVELSNIKKAVIYKSTNLDRSKFSKRKNNPDLWKLKELKAILNIIK